MGSDEVIFIKNEKKANYTVIHNGYVKNPRLSWDAKGVFTYILSLSSDETINLEEISKHSTDGMTILRSAIKELEKEGYIKISKERNENGSFAGIRYEISENGAEQPQENVSQKTSEPVEKSKPVAKSEPVAKKTRKTGASKRIGTLLKNEEIDELLKDEPQETIFACKEIVNTIFMINKNNDPKYSRSELYLRNRTKDLVLFLKKSERSVQEAKSVYNFVIQDNFWKNVVKTTEIFIRNYEKILQKMKSVQSYSSPKQNTAYKAYNEQNYYEGEF